MLKTIFFQKTYASVRIYHFSLTHRNPSFHFPRRESFVLPLLPRFLTIRLRHNGAIYHQDHCHRAHILSLLLSRLTRAFLPRLRANARLLFLLPARLFALDFDAGRRRHGEHPRRFRTCGVVSSAGSIEGLGLGAAIDANEAVFRFNQAPTKGFEQDVGTKTTFRFVDSQVVGWPMYGLMEDPIFRQPGNTKSLLIKHLLRFKFWSPVTALF